MIDLTDADKVRCLQDWDLSEPCERVAREHPDWSAGRLTRAETGYRQFLFLRMTYPGTRLVPHVDVDEVWHAHILHTRSYMALCDALLGGYFHHTPTRGGQPSPQDIADYGHTRQLIRHHFGADKDPVVWLSR